MNGSEKDEDGQNNIASFEQFETDSNYRQEKETTTLKNHFISNKMQGVTMMRTTKTQNNTLDARQKCPSDDDGI